MKRLLTATLACLLLLSGCARDRGLYQRFSRTFYGAFDTVVALTCYAEGAEAFENAAAEFETELWRLHGIFDRYEKHPGIVGLWDLNHAGGEWIQVEPELYDLLEDCAQYVQVDGGGVNIALGNVLEIWHDFRAEGTAVPDADALRAAALHADSGAIEMDPDSGRVRLADPEMTLDLGAVAKGWAVERLAQYMEKVCPDFLIDAGGNVRAGMREHDKKDVWMIGLTDPEDPSGLLLKLHLRDLSAVTSGGYQRYYEVDGVRYHHIIDPETLMPADHLAQVTILAEDSGLADYLSTALFVRNYEEGRAIVEALDGVEAVWVLNDGTVQMTDGAQALVVTEK